jgi:hypothetical protein
MCGVSVLRRYYQIRCSDVTEKLRPTGASGASNPAIDKVSCPRLLQSTEPLRAVSIRRSELVA